MYWQNVNGKENGGRRTKHVQVRRWEKDEHRGATLLERPSWGMGEEKQLMDGKRGGKRWLQHGTTKGTKVTPQRRDGKQRWLLVCAPLPGDGSTSSTAAGAR